MRVYGTNQHGFHCHRSVGVTFVGVSNTRIAGSVGTFCPPLKQPLLGFHRKMLFFLGTFFLHGLAWLAVSLATPFQSPWSAPSRRLDLQTMYFFRPKFQSFFSLMVVHFPLSHPSDFMYFQFFMTFNLHLMDLGTRHTYPSAGWMLA